MKKYLSLLLCMIILLTSLVSCEMSGDDDWSKAETTATPANDFQIQENGNGITITKYIGNLENVVIPESINGKPVTEISDEAFLNKGIVAVSVPAGVAKITEFAFKGCKDLDRVVFNGNAPADYDRTPGTLTCEGNYFVYFYADAEGAPEFNEYGMGKTQWCGYLVLLRDDSKFSMPFGDPNADREPLTDEELKSIIDNIPPTYYEEYPSIPVKPLSATLYLNGVAKEIDLNDSRLIRIVNFFANTTYHDQYSFTPQPLTQENIDIFSNEPNRLVLTYDAKTIPDFEEYTPSSNAHDTVVISTSFMLINHNAPVWSNGGSSNESFTRSTVAYMRSPYAGREEYNWLELFGFIK